MNSHDPSKYYQKITLIHVIHFDLLDFIDKNPNETHTLHRGPLMLLLNFLLQKNSKPSAPLPHPIFFSVPSNLASIVEAD